MKQRVVLIVLLLVSSISMPWAGPAESQLDSCQSEVDYRSEYFVDQKLRWLGRCLGKMSRQLVRSNRTEAQAAAAAASTCVMGFGKLDSLEADLMTKIKGKCDPATHLFTPGDVLTGGDTVLEGLDAASVGAYCANFGGDGTIDDVDEWIACLLAVNECAVDASLAAQYPRLLDWLELVRTDMVPIDSNGAVASLDEVLAAIDGAPAGDLLPDIRCGGVDCDLDCPVDCGLDCPVDCGLDCPVDCGLDCPMDCDADCPKVFVGDGFGANPALDYTDNLDGTITDNVTGCMWEKKVAGGTADCSNPAGLSPADLHGVNLTCTFAQATGAWIDAVNAEAGMGHAGYSDWRVPHIKELQSIVDYSVSDPSIDAVFDPTVAFFYWSSTPVAGNSNFAWDVVFDNGFVGAGSVLIGSHMRAARGCR